MARKTPVLVALDLETTGLNVEQDTILEVAAVKFQDETVLDTLEMLIDPGRPIPYRIQRLTGITSPMLLGAPSFDAVASRVQQFIGDLPIVGHSIPFDVSFLRRRGLVRTNALIDTFELATVLLPSLTSYNLGQVADALGIVVAPGRHRAMVDTLLARDVYLALRQRLAAIDLSLLKDLAALDAPGSWPLLGYLRHEYRQRQIQDGVSGNLARGSLGDRFAAQLGVNPRILSFAVAREPAISSNPSSGTESVDSIDTDTMPPPGPAIQTLTEIQTKVEVIPEQARQSAPLGYQTARSAVYQALEQKTPLLMEVTIGGNDYTPALLPVLEWLVSSTTDSVQAPKRLVIACASQQSARRLIDETLPHLQTMLKSTMPVAYLARKDGYLCFHRWFGPAFRRTSGELTAEQARGLAKLALWVQETQTGERSELTILPQETAAWQRISSGYERIPSSDEHAGSTYERCHYRRKGYCFVSRAEERVRKATIVVTTHAALLDDLSRPYSLLSSIERRLILDADMLEEESTRWSSVELDQVRLNELLCAIGTELPGGRYQGLLALAAPTLRENGPGGLSATPTIAKTELDARMRTWFQTLRQTTNAVDELFKSFGLLLEEYVSGNDGNGKGRGDSTGRGHGGYGGHSGRNNERADQPLRLTSQTRNLSAWMSVSRSWQQVSQRIQSVIALVNEAERIILATQRGRHGLNGSADEEDATASELATIAYQLQEFKRLGQQALALNEDDKVYWLRMPPPPLSGAQQMAQQRQNSPSSLSGLPEESCPVLYSQLAQTPTFFKKTLLQPGICTIFAGVAISVDNSFSFCRSRFGMDSENVPALTVVTEHHEQTLLYLPTDVPEPNMPQYQRHLDDALVQLITALEGQTVVLYTSHAALRSSYAAIKPILEGRGILVLAQGIDGSPRLLWSTFATQERVVILGTGSFWDSIGEISIVPACIVVTRLPMPVLNDPPIAVRAAQYNDQLHQLTVPVAALRVRRALNRLAWSGTRRNAVVLFDRRITSKEYGSAILHTLPHCSQRKDGISHAPETILDWLTATGSWD